MQKVMMFRSPWGWMGVAESSKGIQAIVLPKRSERAVEADLRAQSNGPLQRGESARLDMARRQLLDYLAGTRHTFDVPLDLSQGTVFQRQGWRGVPRVAPGQRRAGGWVAMSTTAEAVAYERARPLKRPDGGGCLGVTGGPVRAPPS